MADPASVQRMSFSEAAAAMSDRLAREGAGLQPEFELDGETGAPPADDATPEAEPGGEAEVEATEPEDSPGGEESDEERFTLPESVNELAELLGVEAGDLYSLKFSLEVDGEDSRTMTLEEMKDYAKRPLQDDVERNRWLDQKRAQEQELQAQKHALDERRKEADTLASVVFGDLNRQEQEITQAYNGLLRNVEFQTRDPQAYQVELMRTNAQLDQVRQQKQGLMTQMQTLRQQMAQEVETHRAQARTAGTSRLREMIPEWKDDASFETGAAELERYLTQERFGVTREELSTTLDPRIYYWAEMARRYEQLQAKAKEKPRPVPTSKLRPGAPKVKLPQGRKTEMEAMDRLAKSGDVRDAQAALKSRLSQL